MLVTQHPTMLGCVLLITSTSSSSCCSSCSLLLGRCSPPTGGAAAGAPSIAGGPLPARVQLHLPQSALVVVVVVGSVGRLQHAVEQAVLGFGARQQQQGVLGVVGLALQGPLAALQQLLVGEDLAFQAGALGGGQRVVGEQVLAVCLLQLGQALLRRLGDAQQVGQATPLLQVAHLLRAAHVVDELEETSKVQLAAP